MRKVYEFIRVDPNFTSSELDRDFYRTKDRAVRSPIPLHIRKSLKRRFPATRRYKELENNTLGTVRRITGRNGGRTGPPEPVIIANEVRERIVAELRPDVCRLREYMGSDFDGWGIA